MANPTLGELFTQVIQNINQMHFHICKSNEYNSSTLVPTISTPDPHTFYLVPGGTTNNLYIEWIYIGSSWEKFGQANIDLTGYATETFVTTRVPAPPVANGTYNLQVVVDNGTSTYSWVTAPVNT